MSDSVKRQVQRWVRATAWLRRIASALSAQQALPELDNQRRIALSTAQFILAGIAKRMTL